MLGVYLNNGLIQVLFQSLNRRLLNIMTQYNEMSLWQCLDNDMQLFSWISKELCDHLDFAYPQEAIHYVIEKVGQRHKDET